MTPKEIAERRFVEEFLTPVPCERCQGRGFLSAYRECPHCFGAVEYLPGYEDQRCSRCKGDGHVVVRGATCPICDGKGVLDNNF